MAIRFISKSIVDVTDVDHSVILASFRITNLADYNALPTQTVAGTVVDEDGTTFQTFAAVGSTVVSDDLEIIGELQSDGVWHRIGGAV